MEQQHELDVAADTAAWEAAIYPAAPLKYDNREYLVAAYRGWTELGNTTIPPVAAQEGQPVPIAYAGGYR
jgi:hypothetical protein